MQKELIIKMLLNH